ncbi:SLAM family member 5 [Stegastes partitus]|uniref:SLAM family member 5 n=1 Tax=Stegastes partitus TaxID=144197 RepID=A0A9Y4NSW3_9TELE|nr:PREDICTED: SLAM family member 5 [Stegastes partitus]
MYRGSGGTTADISISNTATQREKLAFGRKERLTSRMLDFVLLALVLGTNPVPAHGEPTYLIGTEGNNITLPDRVTGCDFNLKVEGWGKETHFMLYNGRIIIRYSDRILLDTSTGQITLTNLQKRDAGKVTINVNTEGPNRCFTNPSTVEYELTVHDSISGPAVETVTATSDSCVLRCAVGNTSDITLRWYKDEEMLKQISSTDSLLLTVTEQNLSSSYRCEAGNPAENTSVHVDVKTLCSGLKHTGDGRKPLWSVLVLVLVLVLVIIALGCCFDLHRKAARCIRRGVYCHTSCDNEEAAADASSQTVNGNMENHHMMPPDAETPV